MAQTVEKGFDTKQAFSQMLNDPNCTVNQKKVLRHRMNNNKITLDKMIELLTKNGYKCIQDSVWIKG